MMPCVEQNYMNFYCGHNILATEEMKLRGNYNFYSKIQHFTRKKEIH